MKGVGMLVVLPRGVNFRFWSHLLYLAVKVSLTFLYYLHHGFHVKKYKTRYLSVF